MQTQICTYIKKMHIQTKNEYANNIQKYTNQICINMLFQNMHYAYIYIICLNMQRYNSAPLHLYAKMQYQI